MMSQLHLEELVTLQLKSAVQQMDEKLWSKHPGSFLTLRKTNKTIVNERSFPRQRLISRSRDAAADRQEIMSPVILIGTMTKLLLKQPVYSAAKYGDLAQRWTSLRHFSAY